jgi:hypothetical protein
MLTFISIAMILGANVITFSSYDVFDFGKSQLQNPISSAFAHTISKWAGI